MSVGFLILTVLFIVVSAVMILIILVQRPQGGGLAGAFGGAGGGSTDTVFGGRVGDALTAMTVGAFLAYLGLAVWLNMIDPNPPVNVVTPAAATQPADGTVPPVDGLTPEGAPAPAPAPAPIGELEVTPTTAPIELNATPPATSPTPGGI